MFEYVLATLVAHSKQLLGFAVIFVALEFLIPVRPKQPRIRPDSGLDLSLSFLGPLLVLPFYLGTAWLVSVSLWGTLPAAERDEPFKYAVSRAPSNGVALAKQDGSIEYQPNPGFIGTDQFATVRTAGRVKQVRQVWVRVTPGPAVGDGSTNDADRTIAFSGSEYIHQDSGKRGVAGYFHSLRKRVHGWSWIVQFMVSILLIDFVGYWRHRLMHCKHLWHFHAVHHSSETLDWLSNERNHPVNQYIIAVVNLVTLVALFHPAVVASNITWRRAYSLFLHANARLSYGPLNYVFTSPVFHHWHHSDDELALDKNYAVYFSFLDWIFGTYYMPEEKEFPTSYGLHQDRITPRLIPQLLHPFTRLNPLESRQGSQMESGFS